MSTPENTVPAGYWKDAQGNLTPESKVKEIDKLRTELVAKLCQMAEQQAAGLKEFKLHTMSEVAAFVAISLDQYGVKTGGNKGNITLTTYDGQYKIVRQMAENIVFGEQLMAAKELIDECIRAWSAGVNDNLRVMVSHAFQTDSQGKINTGRVLGLRRYKIEDEKWKLAMDAIDDSIQVAGTKPYIRFYKRDEATLEYKPIVLDAAAA